MKFVRPSRVSVGQCGFRQLCTSSNASPAADTETQSRRRDRLTVDGPSFKDFIHKNTTSPSSDVTSDEAIPYIDKTDLSGNNRRGRV